MTDAAVATAAGDAAASAPTGRSVLVTGGNRGIGLAVARSLAARGDRVAVTYRTGEPPAGFLAVRCDVTDEEQVERAFKEVAAAQGPVEVLVANAGIARDGLLPALADDAVDAVLDTNLRAVMRVARHASRAMIGGRWGRMVLISSAVAFTGSPGQTAYTAAKAGLVGLARSLAWELGRRGITVNVVAPGLVETDMLREVRPARLEQYLAMTPLGRAATPEEVAAAVRFLTSEQATYITGAVLPVSGGLGMGH
ncbi:3-oxoacyl-ACP reductase FabG [Streptomyces argyrophyllae]|uniref:3-oxoacyl-ACP reductase FabG n=1 Tax=Streptomyces argyrophylli TaxID=2726118 RepID=A0A6M4PLX7_9ACTN|nr:3-oxoacyl-ACP reductase FabG [Streptomyces argyrophyllae]QJS11013.1 3-oxoacyl-ACP reductase FabG [Streptomyces argyrophyllae]